MQLRAGLEVALDLLKQGLQLSKAIKSGARGMIEGNPTQSVCTYFVLSDQACPPVCLLYFLFLAP